MKPYTTAQGDMWDSIAHAQLGNAAYMDKLIQANLAYREYYIFPAGIVLTLPEITQKASDTLPPWKGEAG